jgi:hypothetical protein
MMFLLRPVVVAQASKFVAKFIAKFIALALAAGSVSLLSPPFSSYG